MRRRNQHTSVIGLALALAGAVTGCGLLGGPVILPFGQITAVQLFDEPNYTIAFSIESAVIDPSAIAQVNWVFGDGGGFVEGPADRATIQHVYAAPGSYTVTAYVFGAAGFVDQITTTVEVAEDEDNPVPAPEPNPDDLPGPISQPQPADDAENVSVETLLRWIAGVRSESHDVYFGTSESEVDAADTTTPDIFLGNQDETEIDPGDLAADTQYFWRVDEVNDDGVTKGSVLSFRTSSVPAKAKSPAPANGSTTARVDQVLSWVAGARTTSHDVYFGKVQADVENADHDSEDIFQGNQAATSFDPDDVDALLDGELLANTDYFWRIDEVGPGGTTKGDVWTLRTAAAPPKIMSANPVDGSVDVNIPLALTWTAAPTVETFDVYFGTDAQDVEAADRNSPEFRGNRATTSFDAPLTGGTDYFWRIDTLGAGGTTKGDVLTFRTTDPPAQVAGPFAPADDSTDVNIDLVLSWNAGAGGGATTTFNIYLGTSLAAVQNRQASALRGTQSVAFTTFSTEDNGVALQPNTTYFWAIEAAGPGGRTAGPVLNFLTGTAPAKVTSPSPLIGAEGVSVTPTLSWGAAFGAANYDVYLGTSEDGVQNATTSHAEYKATVGVTSFTPAALNNSVEYFWRIDSNGPGGVTKGDVWRFTTVSGKATDPTPVNFANGVELNIVLRWSAGDEIDDFEVYFGTSQADVTNSTFDNVLGTVTLINTTDTAASPGTLTANTLYFWRVDLVASDGTTRTKGDTWRFTTLTAPAQVGSPSPINGATNVSVDVVLSWGTAQRAATYDVYFGTDQNNLLLQNNQTGTTFDPGTLQNSTTYFWRIDSVNDAGTTTGIVWSFTTAAP